MYKVEKQRSILLGRLWIVLLAITIAGSWSCGGGSGSSTGGATPTPTPTPTATPTPTPVTSANVLELKVLDTSVPATGIFQFQLSTTEPKPIGHGSTRPQVPSGPVRGVAVNDPSGLAAGIAVVNGSNIAIQLSTPSGTVPQFGTDVNYPIVTMSMQLTQNAQQPLNPGDTFPIGIANPVFFPDTASAAYPTITTAAGTLTIAPAGSPAVNDVIPGGGLLPNATSSCRTTGPASASATSMATCSRSTAWWKSRQKAARHRICRSRDAISCSRKSSRYWKLRNAAPAARFSSPMR